MDKFRIIEQRRVRLEEHINKYMITSTLVQEWDVDSFIIRNTKLALSFRAKMRGINLFDLYMDRVHGGDSVHITGNWNKVIEYCEQWISAMNHEYELMLKREVSPIPTKMDDRIKELSPLYAKVLEQAVKAEKIGLDEICGAGYRRAAEILVKDYACHLHPTKKGIKGMPALNCVNQHINSPQIMELAEGVFQIGNDQAHYEAKYIGKTLEDLKKLIKLTEKWIALDLETANARPSLPSNEK